MSGMIYRFADCELNLETYRLTRAGKVETLRPRAFDLLLFFLRNPGRLVSREELFETVWDGHFVSDSALSSQIKALRQAIGDDGRKQALLQTAHGRGFRLIAQVSCDADKAVPEALALTQSEPARQDIRYCTTGDGVRIAYAITGSGPPIVKTANWMSHLDFEWESPVWRHWLHALTRERTLVRYDERGNGLSDREVDDLSFEAMVADLETVVDTLGLERFPLFGISQGCAVAIEYAVRHPERVSCLILYGGFAAGWRKLGTAVDIGQREALTLLMRTGWGQDNPAFRQVFTSRFIPGASTEQMDWFNELQRISVTPATAARFHMIFGTIDVRERLAEVTQPTLVLHARDDGEIPLIAGRIFATEISQARFVPLDSANHLLLENETAFERLVSEIDRFLCEQA